MEFVILQNTWERILSSIDLASRDFHAEDMDLGVNSELGRALNNVREMRGEWNEILRESTVFALKVGILVSSFIEKRTIKIRIFFDEEARDEPISLIMRKLYILRQENCFISRLFQRCPKITFIKYHAWIKLYTLKPDNRSVFERNKTFAIFPL